MVTKVSCHVDLGKMILQRRWLHIRAPTEDSLPKFGDRDAYKMLNGIGQLSGAERFHKLVAELLARRQVQGGRKTRSKKEYDLGFQFCTANCHLFRLPVTGRSERNF